MSEKKTNSELLIKLQNIAEEYNKKKDEIALLLDVLDNIEIEYYKVVEEIKNNK